MGSLVVGPLRLEILEFANSRIESATRDETTFISQKREFEGDEERLADELEQVAGNYENQVYAACGNAFDLGKADWAACGQDDRGAVGSKLTAIQQAIAHMQTGQARVEDKQKAIVIEQDRVRWKCRETSWASCRHGFWPTVTTIGSTTTGSRSRRSITPAGRSRLT